MYLFSIHILHYSIYLYVSRWKVRGFTKRWKT